MSTIPDIFSRPGCKLCSVGGRIYLVGGRDGRKVTEYNPGTNVWKNMPSLLKSRLGRLGTPCIIQLFLGTPLIDIHEKLHSSSQNSKTKAGAGLDVLNMDQSETRHIRSGF